MTGLKLLIAILSHLGDSVSYDLLCEKETAEAEVAQKLHESRMDTLTQETTEGSPILTHW